MMIAQNRFGFDENAYKFASGDNDSGATLELYLFSLFVHSFSKFQWRSGHNKTSQCKLLIMPFLGKRQVAKTYHTLLRMQAKDGVVFYVEAQMF